MNREELLRRLCPNKNIYICCSGNHNVICEDCEKILNTYLDEYDKHIIEQCEAEHNNLADMIRDIHDCVAREMYCKGIDDLVHKVKEHHYVLSDVINSRDYGMFTVGIEQIAEELKEQENK